MLVNFLFIFLLSFTNILGNYTYKEQNIEERNILTYIFPGKSSNILIFVKLIKFTIKKLKIEHPNTKYFFHIIIHNSDFNIWNKFDNDTKQFLQFEVFGNESNFNEKSFSQIRKGKPSITGFIFGNKKLQNLINILNNEILEYNILDKLKKKKIKFDLILTDSFNMITSFFKRELQIEKIMNVNPTCEYPFLIGNINYNSLYENIIGISFNKEMKLFRRFFNYIYQKFTSLIIGIYFFFQNKSFDNKGYKYIELYQPNSFFMNQCIEGIHFSKSLPTNFVSAGYFSLKKNNKQLKEIKKCKTLNDFLDIYKINILINLEKINTKDLNAIASFYKNYGFIYLKKSEVVIKETFPKNLFLTDCNKYNYILKDKRISIYITNGELNNIIESLYHKTPIIAIGNSIEELNNINLIKNKKFGFGFLIKNQVSKNKIIEYINEILNNEDFKTNCLKASEIIKNCDGKENFYYWLNYIMNIGYEHLVIPSSRELNLFKQNNYDILTALMFFLLLFGGIWYFIIYKIIKKISKKQ